MHKTVRTDLSKMMTSNKQILPIGDFEVNNTYLNDGSVDQGVETAGEEVFH